MIVPSLAALLANTPRQMISDFRPEVRSVDADQVEQQPVLDVRPGPLDQLGIQDFLPSVQALHVRPSMQRLGDLLPVLAAIEPNGLGQFLVFFLSPVAFNFRPNAIGVLRLLVLGRASLVQVRILSLMSNQICLSLAVTQVVDILRKTGR